jgi:hypothetical protein
MLIAYQDIRFENKILRSTDRHPINNHRVWNTTDLHANQLNLKTGDEKEIAIASSPLR